MVRLYAQGSLAAEIRRELCLIYETRVLRRDFRNKKTTGVAHPAFGTKKLFFFSNIVTENIRCLELCAKWVDKMLTDEHKEQRIFVEECFSNSIDIIQMVRLPRLLPEMRR